MSQKIIGRLQVHISADHIISNTNIYFKVSSIILLKLYYNQNSRSYSKIQNKKGFLTLYKVIYPN